MMPVPSTSSPFDDLHRRLIQRLISTKSRGLTSAKAESTFRIHLSMICFATYCSLRSPTSRLLPSSPSPVTLIRDPDRAKHSNGRPQRAAQAIPSSGRTTLPTFTPSIYGGRCPPDAPRKMATGSGGTQSRALRSVGLRELRTVILIFGPASRATGRTVAGEVEGGGAANAGDCSLHGHVAAADRQGGMSALELSGSYASACSEGLHTNLRV
ncbi:hypothetical protein FKP32DRAFT_1590683 [Trametes sanguinea]|nr:hypothetical protein FKP32DRAFT_1590683 [Trametes sanguinea]